MSGDERGTKRSNPDSEADHGDAHPSEKAAAGSFTPAAERMDHTTQSPPKAAVPLRSQAAEPTNSYLVAGQLAVDTIIQRLSTGTPRAAIESIQRDFSLDGSLMPFRTIIPVLPLLDQLGVCRSETYCSLLNALQARMLETISGFNPQTPEGKVRSDEEETESIKEKLEALLDTTFPFVGFEELRAVPIKVMLTMTRVPVSFLRRLAQDPQLYKACDIKIQRQIWQADEMLFRSEVLPLLNERLLLHAEELQSPGGALDWATRHEKRAAGEEETTALLNPKARRDRDTLLQALVRLLGDSYPVYKMLLHLLRTLYATTASSAFCTLRFDVLLCLHDHSMIDVCEKDACDNFALLLDAFLRERKSVDGKRIRDLMHELKVIAGIDAVTLQDAAMLLADPYIEQALIRDVYTRMLDVVEKQGIPKDDEALLNVAQMLVLGLSARDRKSLGVHKLPKEVATSFFPALANAVLEARIYDMSKTDGDAEVPAFSTLSSFWAMPLARKVILYYLIRRLEEGDATLFTQFTEFADRTSFSVSSEPALAQSLVSVALHTKHAEIRTASIENFLLKRRAESTLIQRQLARFMLHGMRHYNVSALMALLQPLAIAVSGTQSAPANDAQEIKQRQMLQHILRQIYDKVAAKQGAVEHLASIAEWGKRPGEKEEKKEEKKEDVAGEKKTLGSSAGPQSSPSHSTGPQSSPLRSGDNSPVK